MRFADLAHFQIRSIRAAADGKTELKGEFTHLAGVRLSDDTDGTVGFLYLSRNDSVYLIRRAFDSNSKNATFLIWPPASVVLQVGARYAYVDYYWNPKQVSFALEPPSAWRRRLFKPQDAVRYRDPSAPGWWTEHVASRPISQGATDLDIIKNGWDHEHCNLCWSKIGASGAAYGYFSKQDNDWLCVRCYKEFIAAHDFRFLQFRK